MGTLFFVSVLFGQLRLDSPIEGGCKQGAKCTFLLLSFWAGGGQMGC